MSGTGQLGENQRIGNQIELLFVQEISAPDIFLMRIDPVE